MTTPPKVSVIVPVYNVEKYLHQCLDSICGQTLTDIEIIVVNDGSTDGSLEIIREYAKKDNRIKVIDKENEGYGKSMNRGLDAALGEYIGIVESDDWIEPDMYASLYGVATTYSADVAKGKYFVFDDNTGETIRVSELPRDDIERAYNPRRHPSIFYFGGDIWAAVYRRSFLNRNDIRFLESPGASYQDLAFYFKVMAMANIAYLVNNPFLHYRVGHRTQSIASKDKVFCVCNECNEIERYMNEKNPRRFIKLERIFNKVKFGTYQWNYSRLDGENKEIFQQRMTQELAPVFERGAIDCSMMSSKERLKSWMLVFPDSRLLKIKYALMCLFRVLIKDQIRDQKRHVSVLFGLIPVAKRSLADNGVQE